MGETEIPKYTARQIALIKGEVKPENNEEADFYEHHMHDILPHETKDRKPLYSVTPDDIERSRQMDKGNTQAGRIGEAMDENDD